MLPLVAKHADVWHTFGDLETYARKSARPDDLAVAAGRDPSGITRAASVGIGEHGDQGRADAEAKHAAGVEDLIGGWPSQGGDHVREFVERVLPGLP